MKKTIKGPRFLVAGLTAMLLLGACNGQANTAGDTDEGPIAIESPTEAPSGDAATEGAADENTVRIATFAFVPKMLEVEKGTTVTFVNDDDILHTFTSGKAKKQGIPGVTKDIDAKPDGLFDEDVDLDDSFEFTFDKAGEYPYYCDIHSGMDGVVVVR